MCGLFGIYSSRSELIDAEVNLVALETLRHRGPDESDFYRDDVLFLGNTRLSILDVEHGQLPMRSGRSGVILAYNGEIYNYPELRDRLTADGVQFETRSDAEIVIRLYESIGFERTLDALEGMFALALWDSEGQILHLARDRIGEKPLYYARTSQGVIFASEIKAILRTGIVEPAVNRQGLFEYFCRGKVSGKKTLFQGIRELEPGCRIRLDDPSASVQQQAYWCLTEATRASSESGQLLDEEAAAVEIHDALLASVKSRMLSDVPVGLLTSGGLDSSLIAGMLASDWPRGQRIECFCAGNRDPSRDESPYARLLLGNLNQEFGQAFKLHVDTPELSELVDRISFLTRIHDEPLQYTNSIQMYSLCMAAREQGMKVLISGEGADELFCGYDRYERTLRSSEIRRGGGAHSVEEILYFGGGLGNASLAARLTGQELESVPADELGDAYAWLERNSGIDLLDRLLLFDQRHRLQTLLQRQDRMGMAASIESRQPFLRFSFVLLCNQLAPALRYDPESGTRKYLLKRIAAEYVPRRILDRPKAGFPSDLADWFKTDDAREFLIAMTSDEDSVSRTCLDSKLVASVISAYYSGTARYEYLVRRLFFLEVWNLWRLEILRNWYLPPAAVGETDKGLTR